jgi:mRNA interferase MazF
MKEGSIVLTSLPQADGELKNRPVLFLRELPPFGDFLVCGISTQVHQAVPEFDEIIRNSDPDFAASGLLADSVIRLGYLAVLPRREVLGSIGSIDPQRHKRLLMNMSRHLLTNFSDNPDHLKK